MRVKGRPRTIAGRRRAHSGRVPLTRPHYIKKGQRMLWDASAILGYSIEASDGSLGTVNDFLFSDDSWRIRWLVVDTGNWLSGRKVLLHPSALGQPDPALRQFPVNLTKRQVKGSPDISTDQPVSRQIEAHVYNYYGWGSLLGQ